MSLIDPFAYINSMLYGIQTSHNGYHPASQTREAIQIPQYKTPKIFICQEKISI